MLSPDNTVRFWGREILASPLFKASMSQPHHLHDTLGRHSFQVASLSIRINRCFHLNADEQILVEASLLHDIGLVGRKDKYISSLQTLRCHPTDSVTAAKDIADVDARTAQAIRAHMWPLSGSVPKSKEAIIVNFSDNLATILLYMLLPSRFIHVKKKYAENR